MSLAIFAGLSVAVFLTSLLSGIFGMAGGLVLLWVLLAVMPVTTAIAVQGIFQMVSTGSRAWFSRRFIDWKILAQLMAGLAMAALALSLIDYRPSLAAVYIIIGLMPVMVWIPTARLQLDASRPSHALLGGAINGTLMIGVGVSGPVIDIFFIRTMIDRRRVIATKAAAQLLSHATKVLFYWNSTIELSAMEWAAIAVMLPLSIAGAQVGFLILQRLTDANFRAWTRWIVTAIGAVFMVQGLMLLG